MRSQMICSEKLMQLIALARVELILPQAYVILSALPARAAVWGVLPTPPSPRHFSACALLDPKPVNCLRGAPSVAFAMAARHSPGQLLTQQIRQCPVHERFPLLHRQK